MSILITRKLAFIAANGLYLTYGATALGAVSIAGPLGLQLLVALLNGVLTLAVFQSQNGRSTIRFLGTCWFAQVATIFGLSLLGLCSVASWPLTVVASAISVFIGVVVLAAL